MVFRVLEQDGFPLLLPWISLSGIAFTLAGFVFAVYWMLRPARALRGIPGPVFGKITSLYRVWAFGRGHGAAKALELHRKYGEVVQTGPNHILIANVEALSQIYGTNLPKSNFYDVFMLYHGSAPSHTVITTQDVNTHRFLRNLMNPHFSAKAVPAFSNAIEECTSLFIQRMEDRCGEDVDLEQWMQYWAGDIAAQTTLGTRLGFMEQDRDIEGVLGGLRVGFRYAASVGQIPTLHSWLIGNRRMIELLGNIVSVPDPPGVYINRILKALEHPDIPKDAKNTIFSWLWTESRSGEAKMSRSDLINFLFVFIAGGGTVAVTIAAVFYFLIQNPSKCQILKDEIEKYTIEEYLDSNSTSTVQKDRFYLDFVIKEAMRLCPITAIPLERIVGEGGIAIGGHRIPAGTKIGASIAAIHSDVRIYGNDASEFKPERWYEAPKESLKQMEKAFMGWSKGSRSCLGKHFALLQMKNIIVQVLRKFDLEWASEEAEWKLKYFWLTEQHGLKVRFRPAVNKERCT